MDFIDYIEIKEAESEYPYEDQMYYEEVILAQKESPAGEDEPTGLTKRIA